MDGLDGSGGSPLPEVAFARRGVLARWVRAVTCTTLRGGFEAISERGGEFGAMDTMGMSSVGRGKIQEESMVYDACVESSKKHDGSLPLVGVNTFLPKEHAGDIVTEIELIRSTEGEKGQQIENVAGFERNRNGYASDGLKPLQATARERRNVFASLMEAVKTHSLRQISHALYEVGGEYRRNM
jgi:methylmalonyl-CoA mutase